MDLSPADEDQLNTILLLEKLRYEFSKGGQPLQHHAAEIQELRQGLIHRQGREPFDNGRIDKAFYKALNKAYGHVD